MSIPEFDPATDALPVGIHEATWLEVAARFGGNATRLRLLSGLRRALDILAAAGCTRVYLGGSFVTAKVEPGDWDACYDPNSVYSTEIPDFVLREDRGRMKGEFGGEMYVQYDDEFNFLSFFQGNKGGLTVGVVALDPHSAQ